MQKHYSDIGPFKCRRCGECCRGNGFVAISSVEGKRILAFLELSQEEFYETYTKKVKEGMYWLKNMENLDCIFLEGNLCRIQAVKPLQCKGFPEQWRSSYLTKNCPAFHED